MRVLNQNSIPHLSLLCTAGDRSTRNISYIININSGSRQRQERLCYRYHTFCARILGIRAIQCIGRENCEALYRKSSGRELTYRWDDDAAMIWYDVIGSYPGWFSSSGNNSTEAGTKCSGKNVSHACDNVTTPEKLSTAGVCLVRNTHVYIYEIRRWILVELCGKAKCLPIPRAIGNWRIAPFPPTLFRAF